MNLVFLLKCPKLVIIVECIDIIPFILSIISYFYR